MTLCTCKFSREKPCPHCKNFRLNNDPAVRPDSTSICFAALNYQRAIDFIMAQVKQCFTIESNCSGCSGGWVECDHEKLETLLKAIAPMPAVRPDSKINEIRQMIDQPIFVQEKEPATLRPPRSIAPWLYPAVRPDRKDCRPKGCGPCTCPDRLCGKEDRK